MVLSSYFYLISNFRQYQKILLVAGVLIGTLSQFFQKRDLYITVNEEYKVFSYVVLLVWVVSGVLNSDIELVVNAIALFCVYFIFCEIYSRSKITVDVFLNIVCGIYIWFIVSSYVQTGISFSSYKGLTYNSNAFGGISAGVFTLVFSYFLSEPAKKYKRAWSLIICIISFFNTIISSSRTSFLTCAIVIFMGFFICRKDIMRFLKRKKKVVFVVGLILLLGIMFIIRYFNIYEIFYDAIIAKFIRKKNNPFDGRSEVWMRVWNEKSLWGHGRKYFDDIGLGAHNTFISILGQYGILAEIAYIGFILSSLKASIKFLKSDCEYKVMPIISAIAFIVMSMAEGMLMKINMLIFYFGLTIIQKHKVYSRRKKDAYT